MQTPKPFPQHWILVRGLIRSRFHWLNFPEELKSQLQLKSVQTVELPGNGSLFNQSSPASVLEAITAFKSQTQLPTEPIGLIGISLGGMLATGWAQLYPAEISHLVLINSSSPLSPFYQRLKINTYPGIIKSFLFQNPAFTEKFILQKTSNNPETLAKYFADYTTFHKAHPVSAQNFVRQIRLASGVNFKQVPEACKLVLASENDRLVSPQCSLEIAKYWNCPIKFSRTAGHDMSLDAPNWIINEIKTTFTG